MKMNFDFKINLWAIVVLAVIVLWLFNRGRLRDEVDRWEQNYHTVQEQNADLDNANVFLNGLVAEKDRAILLTEKELRDAMKSDSIQKQLIKKYKKLAAAVKIETVIKIDTVIKEIPINIENDSVYRLWFDCFDMDIGIEKNKFSLYHFYMENRQDIVLGERKAGPFRTEQTVVVHNSNQCIETTGMTTYSVVVRHKWWNKWWISGPVGFAAGYGVGKLSGQ